eukprot:CAMPEP_0194374172 /NCGR_PEP_ID=MMETSP0174-20130528/22547_1 /TAXON_ID=216777 /ORGANISM="Proboscia alata, Strain PI-D3" /LENGTH=1034 /DNA_ID=CAMNT_0039153565 /DNA_START=155 /DNA_END=3256 /DNA_ORIENTATION=-
MSSNTSNEEPPVQSNETPSTSSINNAATTDTTSQPQPNIPTAAPPSSAPLPRLGRMTVNIRGENPSGGDGYRTFGPAPPPNFPARGGPGGPPPMHVLQNPRVQAALFAAMQRQRALNMAGGAPASGSSGTTEGTFQLMVSGDSSWIVDSQGRRLSPLIPTAATGRAPAPGSVSSSANTAGSANATLNNASANASANANASASASASASTPSADNSNNIDASISFPIPEVNDMARSRISNAGVAVGSNSATAAPPRNQCEREAVCSQATSNNGPLPQQGQPETAPAPTPSVPATAPVRAAAAPQPTASTARHHHLIGGPNGLVFNFGGGGPPTATTQPAEAAVPAANTARQQQFIAGPGPNGLVINFGSGNGPQSLNAGGVRLSGNPFSAANAAHNGSGGPQPGYHTHNIQVGANHRMSINLPHLVAQPLPIETKPDDDNANGSSSRDTVTDLVDRELYECPICREILDDPSACGHSKDTKNETPGPPKPKCSGRFCYACILRVASTMHNNNPPKCPTCRCEFQKSDIVRDAALAEKMANSQKVVCIHRGCTELLPLNKVKEHESSLCKYMRMKCKYAQFGCAWRGTKLELEKHQGKDKSGGTQCTPINQPLPECPFGKVAGLIEQFRLNRALHDQQIQQQQQQITASLRIIHMQGQQLMNIQAKSVDNLLDVFTFAYISLCLPKRFAATKDTTWRHLFQSPVARCTLYNFFFVLPTIVLIVRVIMAELRGIFHTYYTKDASGNFTELNLLDLVQHDDFLDSFADFLMAVLISLMGVFVYLCFCSDNNGAGVIGGSSGSPTSWTHHEVSIPFFWKTEPIHRPIFRDSAALSLTCLYCICFTECFSKFADFLVCGVVSYASVTFTAALSVILEQAATPQSSNAAPSEEHYTNARVREVVLLATRYGLLLSIFGPQTMIDVVIHLKFFRHIIISNQLVAEPILLSLLEDDLDNTRSEISPNVVCAAYAVRASVFWALGNQAGRLWFISNLMMALVCTVGIKYCQTHILVKLGRDVGSGISQTAINAVLNNNTRKSLW